MTERNFSCSTTTGTASQRLRQASQNYKYAQGRSHENSSQQENWRSRQGSAINSGKSSIVDQDGFTTVSSRRQSSTGNSVTANQKLRRSIPMMLPANTHGTLLQAETMVCPARKGSVLSRAAVERGSVYASSGKADFKQSGYNRRASMSEKTRASYLTKDMFALGMIIRTVHHEPDFTEGFLNAMIADEYRTESKFGPICSKYRKMIVVVLYRDHYVAIPVYSHNGRGSEKRIDADELVSVQDHRLPPAVYQTQSPHTPLVTEQINTGVDLWHIKSAAHFTYPVSRKYNLPVIVEGTIGQVSLAKLTALMNTYSGMAHTGLLNDFIPYMRSKSFA